VAGVVETVVFGGQTVSMSLRTMRDVYGVTADSELALKATSAAARPVLRDRVDRIVSRDYPNLAVLSNEELKSKVEDQVNQQFGIFYAISGNGDRHWDISETIERLGYRPQDDAEDHAERLDALSREGET